MKTTSRTTVDLTNYPDLVVIYLGMRAHSLKGLKTLRYLGGEIRKSVAARPEGLLCHETFTFSLVPPHAGIRQYWRDFESLERWTRSLPHKEWWSRYLRDSEGTSFWHETYFMAGGMEAIYDHDDQPVGFLSFAPAVPARNAMFSARRRAGRAVSEEIAPVIPEAELV